MRPTSPTRSNQQKGNTVTTKSPQEIEDYLAQNEDEPNKYYGVRIYPDNENGESGYRVELIEGFGWIGEINLEDAFLKTDYPFGTDQSLYQLLDRFNQDILGDPGEPQKVYLASGNFYNLLDNDPESVWYNDVEMIKL